MTFEALTCSVAVKERVRILGLPDQSLDAFPQKRLLRRIDTCRRLRGQKRERGEIERQPGETRFAAIVQVLVVHVFVNALELLAHARLIRDDLAGVHVLAGRKCSAICGIAPIDRRQHREQVTGRDIVPDTVKGRSRRVDLA